MPVESFFVRIRVPKLQHVPILICDDGSYPLEPNTYVVERSCGEWGPDEVGDPTVPTLKSRRGIASRLCAFFRFCQLEPTLDWRRMNYHEHLLGKYQPGLLNGTRSATRRPLSAATVNAYLDEAVLFLTWAAERGHRPAFKVSLRSVRARGSSGAHSHSHNQKVLSQRHGKIQVISDPLPTLPSVRDVARWLNSLRLLAPVKALQFELMIRTGTRISEANQLRTTCFPDKAYEGDERWHPGWVSARYVPVKLTYGVKGGKVEPAAALSTRSRIIEVPLDLADRIWHYKRVIRPTLILRFKRDGRSRDASDRRLWLGESKGQPVSNAMLYKAWTTAPHCPEGWNPHDGRHFFAVEKICEHTRLMLLHHGRDAQNVSVGWLHGLMAGQVRLILSPLMGHVDERTTMRYLNCAQRRLVDSIGHPSLDWNQYLDSDLESSE